MSFGALQRAFSKRCLTLMIQGNEAQAKEDLREYINYLQAKAPLLEQFHVYENFYHHTEKDRDLAIMFIKETLAQLDDLTRGDVLTLNTLLKHKFNLDEQKTQLDEAIALLIEARVSDFDYDTSRTSTAFRMVLEYVMADKAPTGPTLTEVASKYNQFADAGLEFTTPQRVIRIGVKKFNDQFNQMFSEAEREMFKKLQQANTRETLTELYSNEYAALQKSIAEFKSSKLDEDIVRNLELAEQKLADAVSVDNLLNIFELRTQINTLRGK